MLGNESWSQPMVFAAVFVVVAIVTVLAGQARKIGNYRARALMTDNELEFFYRLSKALPQYMVFP